MTFFSDSLTLSTLLDDGVDDLEPSAIVTCAFDEVIIPARVYNVTSGVGAIECLDK